ncbi:MAG TPA: CPBP family intramembrane glutamic endopeptidase [Stellaceae bacterium]|nr:CPBP family intramembrane glutamic endopeptidase [Stellaceae bacterium]
MSQFEAAQPIAAPTPSLPTGRDVLIAAGIFIALLVVMIVGVWLFQPPGHNLGDSDPERLGLVLALLLAQNAAILFAVWVAVRRNGRNAAVVLGIGGITGKRLIVALIAGAVIGPLLSFGISLLQSALGQAQHTPGVDVLAPAGFTWVGYAGMLVVGGIVAPFAEEVMFRGLLFGWLRRRMRPWLAALASAIPFGLAHIQPEHIVYAIGAGFLLALVYQRLGSLWASVAAHVAINALAISYVYISLYYGVPMNQL